MRRPPRRTGGFLLTTAAAAAMVFAAVPAGAADAEPPGPTPSAPALSTSPSAAPLPAPTVDPTAPTPTAPLTGLPPQGGTPGGATVGGETLAARGVVRAADAPALPPGIAASGWLVADIGSGAVLAARDPHGRYYPASTLKTLTLLVLWPRLDPDLVVIGAREDEAVEGSRVGLVEGGRYPVRLLFEAMMLQSGNDAANALSRAAGGRDRTVAAMNATARRLGAHDTVAGTPSGLDVAGQSSSPYDLALFFREVLEDPGTAALLRTRTAQVPGIPGRFPGYQIQNQNPLLGTHPGNLGAKSGFTDAARHTFVTAAERGGRRLVVSVMDTENRPLAAAEQAARLLDWGFTVPAGTEGVGLLVRPEDLRPTTAPPSPTSSVPAAADATPGASAAAPAQDAPSPLVPALLAAGAVCIVAATLVGRRRARHAPPRQPPAGLPGAEFSAPPSGRQDSGTPPR